VGYKDAKLQFYWLIIIISDDNVLGTGAI